MKTLKIFLALLFLTILFTQTVFSWGNRKTLKELVNSAPIIAFGKVLEVSPQVEEYLGQDDFIITYMKLSVQTFFKGKNSEQILTLKIPGGQIDDRVIGGERSFRLTKNEEVLLFLNPIENNYYEIYSISGKLTVQYRDNEKYLDCSLLKEDEISIYGPNSVVKSDNIINKIINYLNDEGGK